MNTKNTLPLGEKCPKGKEKEFLKELYPTIEHEGESFYWGDHKIELSEGDIALYLDSKDLIVKVGIIEDVTHSMPMHYPCYTIDNIFCGYTQAWPPTPEQLQLLETNEELLAKIKNHTINNLTDLHKKALGLP